MDWGQSKHVVIEVSVVDGQTPEAEDRDVAGVYAFSFLEGEASELTAEQQADGLDRFQEHALDIFHGQVAIGLLEVFDISARTVDDPDLIPAGARLHESGMVILGPPGSSLRH